MITENKIERRCRYRLRLHGMKMHKTLNDLNTPVYYVIEEYLDEWPKYSEDKGSWYNLDGLRVLCEELQEKDEIAREENRMR